MKEKKRKTMREAIRGLLEDLRFMKRILSWRVTWIPTLVGLAIFGFWAFYSYAHMLPNPWRNITIALVILILVILAPGVLFLSRRKQ